MGARKHIKAEERKQALRSQYFAKLKDCPSSPRKMRYVVDMVRGMEVNRALGVLRFSRKAAAQDVEKLLRSAIANWEIKNDRKVEGDELYISKIFVDEGVTMKRMRPHLKDAVTEFANVLTMLRFSLIQRSMLII